MLSLISLLVVVLVAFAIVCALQWGVFRAIGEPFIAPLDFGDDRIAARTTVKFLVQLFLLLVLVGFPFAIGSDPVSYFARRLGALDWARGVLFFILTMFLFIALWLVCVKMRWFRPRTDIDSATARRKIARACATALPVALLEEALFRGVVLEQLLIVSGTVLSQLGAIVLAAAIFAISHFSRRRREHKPVLQPALGLFWLGIMLGMVCLIAGRTLWLPIFIHAATICSVAVARQSFDYIGPPMLIGFRSTPFSGLLGAGVLLVVVVTTALA